MKVFWNVRQSLCLCIKKQIIILFYYFLQNEFNRYGTNTTEVLVHHSTLSRIMCSVPDEGRAVMQQMEYHMCWHVI